MPTRPRMGPIRRPPDPWSASNYAANFAILTASTSSGSPLLTSSPGTNDFVIEYDSSGHVWIERPGLYGSYTTSSTDFLTNAAACNVARSPQLATPAHH